MTNIIFPNKLITIKNNKKYYTSTIKNKQSLLSFDNLISANNCGFFLAEYKHRYGLWPSIDIHDSNVIELPLLEPIKRNPILSIFSNELKLLEEDIESLQCISFLCNIDLLGITEFNYTINRNKFEINFKAANLSLDKEANDYNTQYILTEFLNKTLDL